MLNLLYHEAKFNVIEGRYVVQPEEYDQLAGIQALIHLEHYNPKTHTQEHYKYVNKTIQHIGALHVRKYTAIQHTGALQVRKYSSIQHTEALQVRKYTTIQHTGALQVCNYTII